MSLQNKLNKILKWEIMSFLVLLSITILLIPFINQFTKTHDTVNKVISMILIIILLLILIDIIFKKIHIIFKVIWCKKNYQKKSSKVIEFLKKRRATLITTHGHISHYQLYNETLKMLENFISDY